MPPTDTARTVGRTARAGTTARVDRPRSTSRTAARADPATRTPETGTPGAATTLHRPSLPRSTERAPARPSRTGDRVTDVTSRSGWVSVALLGVGAEDERDDGTDEDSGGG